MSNLERCDSCQGRKVIMGIGGMQKDCQPCNGIGWVEPKAVKIEGLTNAIGAPVVAKKRGRKPKSEMS